MDLVAEFEKMAIAKLNQRCNAFGLKHMIAKKLYIYLRFGKITTTICAHL
jgi:hypothetical protein